MPVLRDAGLDVADRAEPASGLASAVFLHSGWRSCGTWLWESLREHPGVRAYYEPLHEGLASLDRAGIAQFRPDSWTSGHGGGAPYFAEYAPMMPARHRRGVKGYDPRFAFDSFFAGPDDANPALHAYLRGLIDAAHAEGRLPVLKFCRSLGRVAWMQRRFPGAYHAVILRDPAAQWRSARRQMERDKNRYFVLAPFLILARNAHHPLLAEAAGRLGVSMPPGLGPDLGVTTEACWRHVKRLSWAQRYRGFLALWAATAVTSLGTETAVIDSDTLGESEAQRQAVEQALGDATGLSVRFTPAAAAPADAAWAGSQADAEDAAEAALDAQDFLAGHAGALDPERYAAVAAKLLPVIAPRGKRPGIVRAAQFPGPLQYLDAAAYVALGQLTYPLRRAHYHLHRFLNAGG